MNWFSGGKERGDRALELIGRLLYDREHQLSQPSLVKCLQSYYEELDRPGSSVPFILSHLNLELSSLLSQEQIQLSQQQEEDLQELRQLSQIRYGY